MAPVLLWREEEHENLTETVWDQATAKEELAAIIADAEQAAVDGIWPGHPQDEDAGERFRTLYLGSAGMIWALARLGSSFGARGH